MRGGVACHRQPVADTRDFDNIHSRDNRPAETSTPAADGMDTTTAPCAAL